MNAFALLDNGSFAVPFNPEVCWWICLALLHTSWQTLIVGLLAVGFAREARFSVYSRFKIAFSAMVLIGCLPLGNYFWISRSAAPEAVSVASQQFAVTGSVPLFLPSELRVSSEPKLNPEGLLRNQPLAPPTEETSHRASPSVIGYWKVSVSAVLTIGYLVGVLLMMMRVASALRKQQQFTAFGKSCLATEETHPKLLHTARLAAKSLGKSLRVPIVIFSGSGAAFVVGVLRPTVLVNATLLTGLTPTQLEHILMHELAHVYRLDALTQFFQRIVESILFYHPMVWAVSCEVSQLRELCCDNLVARNSTSAEYADTLLRCYVIQSHSNAKSQKPALALPAVGQISQLSKRINELLESESPQPISKSHRTRSTQGALGILGLTSAVLIVAIVSLTWRPAAPAVAQDVAVREKTDTDWQWQRVEAISVESPAFWFGGNRLPLSKNIPDDIQIEAMVDPASCQIAQWHFGDSISTRLAILIEGDEDFVTNRIFIDSNRNRKIEDDEELTTVLHDGKVWLADVAAAVSSGSAPVFGVRQIAISLRKNTVRVKTLGFVEGELMLDGVNYSARRIDVDGNGLPVDNRDQLLIDLNSDGEFDLLSEQFLIGDHLTIASQRYLVRSDRLGHSIMLTSDLTRGQIEFVYELDDKTATLETLEGALRDESGMLIAVRVTGEPISVPPGRYCLESLAIQARDAARGTWRMTLSENGNARWFNVTADSAQQIRLLEEFQFEADHVHDANDHSEYRTHLKPSVKTGNGLVLRNFEHLQSGEKPNLFRIADSVEFEVKNSAGETLTPKKQTCSGFN